MKAGQFSNEQIVAILQEAQKGEKPVTELCKDKGISEATFYTWRKKFGGLQTRDVTRLRELEKENARLKRLLAERDLENDVLKEALAKKGERSPETRLGRPGASAWFVRTPGLPACGTVAFRGKVPSAPVAPG